MKRVLRSALLVYVAAAVACAPKEYHTAVVADRAYSEAVFALQDAEIASHNAKLISDAKHQDYKKIVAKLLRAGDAVTISLQHWQPGTPMPQVVAGAWQDASALLADVKAILPGSDPFIQKIQDLLSLLQKFGVVSSEVSGVGVGRDALAAAAFDSVDVFGIGSGALRIDAPSHDREVAVKRVVVSTVLSRSFGRGCDSDEVALMPTVGILNQEHIHPPILHLEAARG